MATQPIEQPVLHPMPRPVPAARPALTVVPPGEPVPAPAPAEAFAVDLPAGVFRAMFGLLGLFLAILFVTFRAPGMGLIGAICAICLLGYFGVPRMMNRVAPPARPGPTLAQLMRNGVETGDGGRTRGHEAIGLALLLPAVLVGWAVAMAVIHAIVMCRRRAGGGVGGPVSLPAPSGVPRGPRRARGRRSRRWAPCRPRASW